MHNNHFLSESSHVDQISVSYSLMNWSFVPMWVYSGADVIPRLIKVWAQVPTQPRLLSARAQGWRLAAPGSHCSDCCYVAIPILNISGKILNIDVKVKVRERAPPLSNVVFPFSHHLVPISTEREFSTSWQTLTRGHENFMTIQCSHIIERARNIFY